MLSIPKQKSRHRISTSTSLGLCWYNLSLFCHGRWPSPLVLRGSGCPVPRLLRFAFADFHGLPISGESETWLDWKLKTQWILEQIEKSHNLNDVFSVAPKIDKTQETWNCDVISCSKVHGFVKTAADSRYWAWLLSLVKSCIPCCKGVTNTSTWGCRWGITWYNYGILSCKVGV